MRTSAGSGPRIYFRNIFLERGLSGTGGKSPVHAFSGERNELSWCVKTWFPHSSRFKAWQGIKKPSPGNSSREERTKWLLLLQRLSWSQ